MRKSAPSRAKFFDGVVALAAMALRGGIGSAKSAQPAEKLIEISKSKTVLVFLGAKRSPIHRINFNAFHIAEYQR